MALARNLEDGTEAVLDGEGVVREDRNSVNIVRWACSLTRETANQVNRRVLKLYDQRVFAAMVARKAVAVEVLPPVVDEVPENAVELNTSGEETTSSEAPTVDVDAPPRDAEAEIVTSTSNNADSDLDPSVAPLRLTKATTASIPSVVPTTSTFAAMGQTGFLDIASELLSSAMLELLRDVVWDEDQMGKPAVDEVLMDSD
jgi:hypothetical protein